MLLLNSARDVCSSLHGLVSQARTANGNDKDHPSYNQVADYSKGVIMNITNFLKSVKSVQELRDFIESRRKEDALARERSRKLSE